MWCSLTLPCVELVCLADDALGVGLTLLHWVGTVEASSPNTAAGSLQQMLPLRSRAQGCPGPEPEKQCCCGFTQTGNQDNALSGPLATVFFWQGHCPKAPLPVLADSQVDSC